jgi:Ca-activated chloride channel family protein
MRLSTFNLLPARRSLFALLIGVTAALSFLIVGASRAQQPVDTRPRQTGNATATPQPTPTPVPQTGPGRRIAPQLGAPPPPPLLKPKPTPTPDPTSAEIDENSRLIMNTELVTLHVRVIDRNNHPINNVPKEDFRISEDGVSQPIFSFTREEVPVMYGLAVDTSGSLRPAFEQVINAAKAIINSNKRGDETFIERFISRDKINIEKEFTANKDELADAIENLYLEGGQTAVIDGVYLAAEHVAEYRKGDDSDRRRRALIVITDGEDRLSYYSEPVLLQRLREEDVQIYVIGFVNDLDKEGGFIKKSPRDKAMNLLNKLATETGGRAFFPQSISEMPEIANAIVRDLRTQYVLSYNPTNKARDGSYRAVRVTVDEGPQRDKRIALTRAGYVAPRQGAAPLRTPAVRTGTVRPAAGPTKSP